MPRLLEVWCFDERAGTLIDGPNGLEFEYDAGWAAAGRPPLSHSLPTSRPTEADAVAAVFGGLLPEGRPRQLLARQLGVSAQNDFSLLDHLGGDTAGAITLVRPGTDLSRERRAAEVDWLDDAGLAELVRTFQPVRCMPTLTANSDSRWQALRTSFRLF